MRSKGWGTNPIRLVSLEEEERALEIPLTALTQRKGHVRTQWNVFHPQGRKTALTKNHICQHSDLGAPNLQNCEKIDVYCLSPPSLCYFVMAAPGDEDSHPICSINALGTNPNLFLFLNSPYPLNSNILLAQDLLQNLSGIHLLLFTCKFPHLQDILCNVSCLLHWSPYLHSCSLPSIPYTTSRVIFIEYQTEHVTCCFKPSNTFHCT